LLHREVEPGAGGDRRHARGKRSPTRVAEPGACRQIAGSAGQHINSVRLAVAADPEGAYALAYDAARKALAAVLENQGLRATTRGGHLAVYRAARAQLDPPLGNVLRPFDRMRRQRDAQEYPSFDAPALTAEDVLEDVAKAEQIIDLAARALDEMSPF
jgi:hypothetical protein